MAERDPIDELDDALEAMMVDRGAPAPQVSPPVADLLRLAGDLGDLPDPGFKSRLAAALRVAAETAAPPPAAAVPPPVDLRGLLAALPTLAITAETTAAEADAAVRSIGWMNERLLGVMRFSGQTPWERHPDGDEMLQVLDGEVEITVLTATGSERVTARAGSLFICPQGLWHRQFAAAPVTILYATPVETSEVSFEDDPRRVV